MPFLIKICGLSTPGMLDVALEAGADMVGLVLHPKSPRYVAGFFHWELIFIRHYTSVVWLQ